MMSAGSARRGARPKALLAALLAAGLLAAGCSAGHGRAGGGGAGGTRGGGGTAASGTVTSGTVTGRLVVRGGVLRTDGPDARPIPGLIEFARAGHRVLTVRAGRSGRFSARLPAGTYRITDRTRLGSCSHPHSVTVTARHATPITLACSIF